MAEDNELIGSAMVEVSANTEKYDKAVERVEQDTKSLATTLEIQLNKIGNALERLGIDWEAASNMAIGFGIIIGTRVAQNVKGFLGLITRTTAGIFDFGAVGLLFVSKGLHAMSNNLRDASGEMTKFGKAVEFSADGLELFAKIMITVSGIILGLQIAAAAAAASLVLGANKAANETQPAWNRVLTVLGGVEAQFFSLRGAVSDLASEMGVSFDEAADTLYEIFGAMPQLLKKPEEAMGLLRESLEVGSTEFATAGEAASLATGIINAFGLEVSASTEILDKFWAAQGAGKFTFGEVAREAGAVAASISALGGSYEDMLAILATTTPLNIPVPEAVTQIESALAGVVQNSPQAQEAARELGIEWGAAEIRAKGLANALLELLEATGGDVETLRKFFPDRQGLDLMIQLAARTGELRQRIEEINSAGGQHREVIDRMNDSWARQKEILGEQLPGVLRQIGFEFEGMGTKALRVINDILFAMRGLDAEGKKMVQQPGWGDMMNEQMADQLELANRMRMQMAESQRLRGVVPEQPKLAQMGTVNLFGMTKDFFFPDQPEPGVQRTREQVAADMFGRTGITPGPVPEPEEDTSLDYVQQKIEDLQSRLRAQNIQMLARTNNMEEYEKATEAARQEVNRLVLSEMERLKVAGEQETTINAIAELYQVGAANQNKISQEQIRASKESLNQMVQEYELRRQFLQPIVPSIPEGVTNQLSRVLQIDREIAQVRELINDASGQAPAGIQKVIEGLEQERTAIRSVMGAALATFESLPAVEAQMTRIVKQTHELASEVVRLDSGEFVSLSAATETVTGSLEQLALAQQEVNAAFISGDTQRIREARENLADTERALAATIRRTLQAYEQGNEEGILSQQKVNELIAEMIRLLREAGVDVEGLTGGKQRDWEQTAESVESLARGVLSVAEAMGILDEESQQALEAVVEVASGVARLVASGGTDIGAWVQTLGGVAKGAAAIFGGDRSQEILMNQLNATYDLTRALKALEKAVLYDVSIAEKQEQMAVGQGLLNRLGGRDFILGTLGAIERAKPKLTDEEFGFLQWLEEFSGIDLFDNETGTIWLEKFVAAWDALTNLDVGAFGNSLSDRLSALEYAFDNAGDTIGNALDRLDMWIEALKQVPEATAFISQFEAIFREQGEAAARAWLEQQALLFSTGGAAALGPLGQNLTAAEIQQILQAAFGRLDDLVEDGGVSQSFQVNRSITEVTADRIFGALTTGNFFLEGIHSNIEMIAQAMVGRVGTISAPDPSTLGIEAGSGVVIQGGISVSVTSAPGEQPEEIGTRIADSLVDTIDARLGQRLRSRQRASGNNRV